MNIKNFLFIAITDMKKERTRNLLPAYVGIYGIIIFLVNTIATNLAMANHKIMVCHLNCKALPVLTYVHV